ncbi:MAG TPA: glycoside hydrolase family 43 protein [Tepidisphaeraceae bacterium]|jgi:GH43 family beta-xylosidase|nr:glycoside hydrolase family 43 protein [Tepidisphaeraceae bacterium]
MSTDYRNPVYPLDFADPFVLRTPQGYYAYGTAATGADGLIFPVLRSSDLATWERLGGALKPLTDPPAVSYWAPEVAEKDGRYYMFYSASTGASDEYHRLRVAVASDPAGPFVDSGRLILPDAGFTIDASPFRDPQTGSHYLFFATDYVTDEPHGTGLAVVALADDLMSATTAPKPVIRAQANWQIYERNRDYKGKTWTKWHCVEGPNVLFHRGKYYCFYSGGAWHGDSYGVGFAVADHPMGPWRDDFAAHGAVVLKGIPGKVIGPGHNSHVLGPDDRTIYMVYHAWDAAKTARRMCIDPIVWTRVGPKVDGPSTGPRELAEKAG